MNQYGDTALRALVDSSDVLTLMNLHARHLRHALRCHFELNIWRASYSPIIPPPPPTHPAAALPRLRLGMKWNMWKCHKVEDPWWESRGISRFLQSAQVNPAVLLNCLFLTGRDMLPNYSIANQMCVVPKWNQNTNLSFLMFHGKRWMFECKCL